MDTFVIEPLPRQLPANLLTHAQTVETATIGHFLQTGFTDSGIQGLIPEMRVAGTAVTVMAPTDDGTVISHVVSQLRPGDVLVIDRNGSTQACWGAILTRAAEHRGALAVIVDGFITDRQALSTSGFPVWSRGSAPLTTKLRGLGGSINRPITCGGTVVHPGDLVLADESGVVFLPPESAMSIVTHALDLQAREIEILARLDAGESLATISGTAALIDKRKSSG